MMMMMMMMMMMLLLLLLLSPLQPPFCGLIAAVVAALHVLSLLPADLGFLATADIIQPQLRMFQPSLEEIISSMGQPENETFGENKKKEIEWGDAKNEN